MRKPKTFLSLILALSVTVGLPAQSVNSSVGGRVSDQTGAVLPGAEVQLINLNTRGQMEAVTNETGRYLFPSVPVGRYTLRVVMPGFKSFERVNFEVVVSQRVAIDVIMEVGEIADSVTVQAGGLTQVLETTSNELGTLIDSRRVQELPLNGRNFLQLGLLSGATQPTRGIEDLVSNQGGHPGRSISMAGLREDISSYKINGMYVGGSRIGHLGLNLSIGAIDQFKVRQGFFEGGEGGGASVVNVVTKTGTNEFHGEVFEYYRSDELDAREFFSPTGSGEFLRNQYGFSVGGPIIKDRIFGFANAEFLRQRRVQAAQAFTPTEAMFRGDFSEFPNPIFNPFSFDPATEMRKPFTNNRIPEDMINPVSKRLLEFYLPGSSLESRPFNRFGSAPFVSNSDQFTVRVDTLLTDTQTLYGQYSDENSPVVQRSLFPLAGSSFPLESQLGMIGLTSTFSSATVNELRAGWTRNLVFVTSETVEGLQTQLGITGTADPDGVPGIGIQGFSGFGRSAGLLGNIDNYLQLNDTVSHIWGNHEFKFGAHFLHAHPSVQQSANANARGNLSFQSVFTAQLARNANGQLGPVANTGSGFADFLLGIPTIGQVVSMPRMHYRWTEFEPFFADTWKIRPNLTLNWGLSWYLATPPDPSYLPTDRDRPHAFDYNIGRPLFAALGEIDPKVYETDYNNLAPRLGFSWRAADDTVIRAGGGIFFVRQRLIDAQFAIILPGVSISSAISNPQSEPMPQFILGQNTFPEIKLEPVTREFAENVSGSLFDLDRNIRTGYVQQWNLSIQRRLSPSDVVEIAYIGNRAVRLNNRWNSNDCSAPDDMRCDRSRIPFPRFPLIVFAGFDGNSSFNALNVRYNSLFSRGFSVLANYTFSKVMTNAVANAAGLTNQRGTNRRDDWGRAFFDIPHRLVVSALWELPFGRDKRFGPDVHAILNQLIGGWHINAIGVFSSGNPVTVTAPNRTGAPFTFVRANRLCHGRDSVGSKDLRKNAMQFLDTSCFEAPAAGFFGDSGMGLFTGPGTNNWDISINKDFPVRKEARLRFQADFFNAFNHAQFVAPQTMGVADANFGQVTGAASARQIQFGLKVMW